MKNKNVWEHLLKKKFYEHVEVGTKWRGLNSLFLTVRLSI